MDVLTLADIEEIRQLTYRYAWAWDSKVVECELYLSIYTEDAMWDASEIGLPVYEGHAQIERAYLDHKQVLKDGAIHGALNHMITFHDKDHASGRSYKLAWGQVDGKKVEFFGAFYDSYVRTAEGWKIKKRVLSKLLP